jgi:predicted NUDIX family NTP pyrophosphohydrolase
MSCLATTVASMAKHSAGILLYRATSGELEVLLVHPGGPFWQRKDEHAWSIPKGELLPGEEPLAGARRELVEETGFVAQGELLALGTVKQSGGKLVSAWAVLQDADPAGIRSNTFELEWPPKSGTLRSFPEVDRAAWFALPVAREKIIVAQAAFLDRLAALAEAHPARQP